MGILALDAETRGQSVAVPVKLIDETLASWSGESMTRKLALMLCISCPSEQPKERILNLLQFIPMPRCASVNAALSRVSITRAL